jgi:deoxyribonuclease-4
MVRFGTAGVGDSFAELGYKKTLQVGEYLAGVGLNHFEYQCGQGVRLSEASGKTIGGELAARGISVSLHAPYFISLSSTDEEKRIGSVRYILESARAVKALGGTRIVIHSGSCAKMSREDALSLAIDTMKLAKNALDENGLSDVVCCPETMGKFNQLGTLDEVLTLCEID